MTHAINVYLLSDTIVDEASALIQHTLSHYPNISANFIQKPYLYSIEACEEVLSSINDKETLILFKFSNDELSTFVSNYCIDNDVHFLNILSPLEKKLSQMINEPLQKEIVPTNILDKQYFERVSAIEFAVQYDDGQDAKGILEADIVLLGVSRSSKTPLSMYLANKNFKVANYPLLPNMPLPKEIWAIEPYRIIGLTTDPAILASIRRERMISYGLDKETPYSNINTIKDELAYVESLYDQLGCLVLDVSNKSIEETAEIIANSLHRNEAEKE